MVQILEEEGVEMPGQSLSAKLAQVLDQKEPTSAEQRTVAPQPTQQGEPSIAREHQAPQSHEPIQTTEIPERRNIAFGYDRQRTQPIIRDAVSLTPEAVQVPRATPPGSRTTQEVWNFPQLSQPPEQRLPHMTESPAFDLPPTRFVPNGPIDPNKITAFQKGWRSVRNYTGKPYDVLYDKARVFVSFCKRLQIEEDQYHAVFPDILSDRAEDFYMNHIGPDKRWDEIYRLLDNHFNTNINHSQYWTDWTTTTFVRTRQDNPEKTLPEVLETMLDRLQLVQRALGEGYQGEIALYTAVARACRGVPELESALLHQKPTCGALFADLRASLQVAMDRNSQRQYLADETGMQPYDVNFVDRKYRSNFKDRQRTDRQPFTKRTYQRRTSSYGPRTPLNKDHATKRCFVCKKVGCWSSNHTQEERDRSRRQYLQACGTIGHDAQEFTTFLVDYEGEPDSHNSEEEESEEDEHQIVQYLQDCAFLHQATGEDPYNAPQEEPADQFILQNQYATVYQGELWDTGAAQVSTVGKCQVEAYLRENPRAKISWIPGTAEIRFGGGIVQRSIGTMLMENPIGQVTYHILDTPTPFLLSLHDADRLKAYFNNVEDIIVRADGKTVPVIRKWGHPFFNTSRAEVGVYLTEPQLRRLHRRFGHPRTERLYRLLKNAGHNDVQEEILRKISKFCHHCQSHDPAPQRFKFTIKDECHFNYEIVIDIVQLKGHKALHVIDVATSFQAATFVRSMSAQDTWNALCRCWIYVYQGPPDIVSHDPGTNFASEEFRNNARIVGISCKEMPIEAHWAIGKIERAHRPLERSYNIIHQEIGHCTDDETVLQMAIKALNDTAGPNGIVPTLLVFGAYPRINQDSPPSPEIAQRAEAVRKAMKILREIRAEVDVNRALNTRNGPTTHDTLNLPLKSEVMVWREGKDRGWEGPYEIKSKDHANVTIEMANGPKTFRTTQVKPYHRATDTEEVTHDNDAPYDNAKEPVTAAPERRRRGRPRKNPIQGITNLVQREIDDMELAKKLRAEGKITTPGEPFEESDAAEINGLLAQDVLEITHFDPHEHGQMRLWKTRLVREVKGKTTKPYEKSRLVVQGYSDDEKKEILTQAPTIQRMSQRLILALGPSLTKIVGAKAELRDITQAYIQSKDALHRVIIAKPPRELEDKYPEGTVFWVRKPLYGLAESGVHWFKTYHQHHTKALEMKVSSYDPCLLFTNDGPDTFAITGMQTDDTLTFATPAFSEKEEAKLHEAGLLAKPKTFLSHDHPLEFNGCKLQLEEDIITIAQKGQAKQLRLVDPRATDAPQQYVAQRARGAYLASICQPEASYDLSIAAQVKDPQEADIDALNKRIQWQMDNHDRGLRCQPLDLSRTKLFVFTDGSFANNRDMTSQLGFLIVLATEETHTKGTFDLQGNIIHWSSTKCKRVTRSVLASELYGMMTGFDNGIAINTTLARITDVLGLARIPLVICSDSRSLYDCLVKLGTTTEKRLMIDIMSLRESYEKREISEIRWIEGRDNPADALTKKTPNQALATLVTTGKITVRVEAFVDRLDSRS